MSGFLLFLIFSEVLLPNFTYASRVRRQTTKVRISAVGNTITLKFLQLDKDTKLEGYILGYGSSLFSKQLIQLPENGQPYETEIDAEPKYLVAVQPVKEEVTKQCTGKESLEKPLHLVIGSVTPTSVMLSWGTLLNTLSSETNLDDCIKDGHYTVRYREKEPKITWNYQTCPTRETVIDQLKPDTPYEFGVRAESENFNGAWSPPVIHNTAVKEIDTHTPQKPENILKMPITESTQTFAPSVSVLDSVTKSRPAFLLRHPAPSQVPRVTLGTESDGLRTARPSEESLFLTHPLTTTHVTLSNFKSTNILPTHHSTKPTLLVTTQQLHHSIKSQTVFSKVNAQLKETQKKMNNLHNNSSATKFSTQWIQEETAKYPIRTFQPRTRPPKPYTIYPKSSLNKSPHSKTKSQHEKTHIRFTTLKPSETKSQPNAAQHQSFITQSQLDMTHHKFITTQTPPHRIQLKSITTESLPHTRQIKFMTTQSPPHTSNLKTITIQTQFYNSQPKPTELQSPPYTTKSQINAVKFNPSTYKPQPTTKILQPLTAQTQSAETQTQSHSKQSQPNRNQPKLKKPHHITNENTTKAQTKTMQPKLTTNYSKTKTNQPNPKPQQSYTLQPQSILTQTSTAKSQDNFRSHQQPVMNQQHNYVTKQNSIPYYHNSTLLEPLSTTEFEQPDYYLRSATVKFSNTKTWQSGNTDLTSKSPPMQPVQTPSANTQNSPWGKKKPVNQKIQVRQMASSQSKDGHQTKPILVGVATNRNQGQELSSSLDSVASTSTPTITKHASTISFPKPIDLPPTYLNISVKNPQVPHDERHRGQLWNKRHKWNEKKPGSNKMKNQLNQVDKVIDKKTDLKLVDALPNLKPSTTPPTQIYRKLMSTIKSHFAYNGTWFNIGDNSSVFSSVPISDLDPMGKKRFVAPHVVYQIDKPPEQPCSVTHSLSFFPNEDNNVTNITGPPRTSPTNLTVVTVEGCSSFVILDWETADNETTEYEVTSSVKSPNGHVVSVVKTNQTHTAVENLKPESSYEFTVTPKNELGSGPSSESVSFSTESADPRVSEIPTGKNAIWSSFKFNADSYSECTGMQYVKRTWYRKFVGIQLCNSLRYKIYLSDSLKGKFYDIGDETGYGEDHCQFVDSFLDGRTGGLLPPHQLPPIQGYFRAMRQEPVKFGKIGGSTQINYVSWYECGVPIPGSW